MRDVLRELLSDDDFNVKENMNTKKFSMDAIDFQIKSKLPDGLADLVTKARAGGGEKNFFRNTEELILNETGLKVTIKLIDGENAIAEPPVLDRNNVLLNNKAYSNYPASKLTDFYAKKKILYGTIDLKKGIVKGDISKINSNIYLGRPFLKQKSRLTAKEVSAAILHEIGHIMSYYEMLGRVTRTNYLLESVSSKLLQTDDPKVRIKMYEDLGKEFKLKPSDIKDVGRLRLDKNGYKTLITSMEYKSATDQLGYNPYTLRGYEQLANVYVSRLGYGVHLAKAIDKITHKRGKRPTVSFILITLFLLPYTPIILLLLLARGANLEEKLYDDPKVLLTRLKSDISDNLKDRTLSDETKVKLRESYKEIDDLTAGHINFRTIYQMLLLVISPSNRKSRSLSKLQEELDLLSNNPLFVTAAGYET